MTAVRRIGLVQRRGRLEPERGSSESVWPVRVVGGLLVFAVVVQIAKAVGAWLGDHRLVAAAILAMLLGAGYLVIYGLVIERRERRERLANLRYDAAQIDEMSPREFELACRDLMRRDGVRAEHVGRTNDQGADVTGSDGRRFVVQCKHTTRASNVGVQVLHGVNGTARQVHGADVVLIVTNGGFTRPARAFAVQHDIHLVDRTRLLRWSDEGESVHSLLGITAPVAARAPSDR